MPYHLLVRSFLLFDIVPQNFYSEVIFKLFGLQVFGGQCDVFLGSLYINIGYVNASTTLNPDIQSGLASLGLSKISQVGLLHVSVGGSSNKHLDNLDFLPNLKVLMLSTSCTLEACQLTDFAPSLLAFLNDWVLWIG